MLILQPKEMIQSALEQATTIRKCCDCKQVKAVSEFKCFLHGNEPRYTASCSACIELRKAKIKARQRKNIPKYRRSLRTRVLDAYGAACACCGESEPMFLAVDHINNDGAAHRREIGVRGGGSFYAWIIRNNFPSTLQLLCHNCNCAKGFYGECPHVKAKLRAA